LTPHHIDTLIDVPAWYDRAGKFVALVGGTLVIIVTIAGGISWATGGLKLGTQVSADELTGKVNNIQIDVAKIKDRVDAFPRQSDFDAQANLNRQVLAEISAIRDQVAIDEKLAAATIARDEEQTRAIDARVGRLEGGNSFRNVH
jgi:biopolymer transport protein ExbB/TolQ